MKPTFFPSAPAFRRWLTQNHGTSAELFVGFHKKSSGLGGLTYEEAVLEALCFGWIDGVMKSLGPDSYQHRFTPRKPGSIWSTANIARVEYLKKEGRMTAAGLAAYAARTEKKSGIYSFEQKETGTLPPEFVARLRATPTAWAHFSAQPAGYRRLMTHWVVSAKRETTRLRRLDALIAASAAERRIV